MVGPIVMTHRNSCARQWLNGRPAGSSNIADRVRKNKSARSRAGLRLAQWPKMPCAKTAAVQVVLLN
jgi:hypothetical protein